MFLRRLNEEQKKVLIPLGRIVIAADGVLAPEEKELFDDMKAEMEMLGREELHTESIDDYIHVFESDESKHIVLFELMLLAHADGDFHEKESRFIDDIAIRFSIPDDKVKQIENLASRQMDLLKEAYDII